MLKRYFGIMKKQNNVLYLNKGFTIIELMIVLALISIISFISIPFYFNYVEKAKEEAVVADLNTLALQLEEHLKKNYTYKSAVENNKLKPQFIQETPNNTENPKYFIKPQTFIDNSNVYIVKAERKDGVQNEFYYLYSDGQAYFIYYFSNGRIELIQ